MRLKAKDLEQIRTEALERAIHQHTPVYLNQEEIADRLNIPLIYFSAVVDFLNRKNLLKEEVTIELGRKSTEGVDE